MDKRIRLWIECDDLRPDGLGVILADADDTDDDVWIKVADHLQKRFAQRIANAVGAVLQEDADVKWENTAIEVTVSFHSATIRGVFTPREANDG